MEVREGLSNPAHQMNGPTKEELSDLHQRLREYRKENFMVKIEPSRYSPWQISLSVTFNGFQWESLSFYPDELAKVIAALQSYDPSKKK